MASLLHLGNIRFVQKPNNGASDAAVSEVASAQELSWVASLLAVDVKRLKHALIQRQIQAKDEWYAVNLTPAQAEEARDAMSRSIYGYLFDWIVMKVNQCIGSGMLELNDSNDLSYCFIGVLDIFGFESFEVNSFEQLCINYANERLQHHFVDFVLTQEQKRYEIEGIPWESLDVPNNYGCLDILENRPTGLLALLDEECNVPKGSDAGLVRKLYQIYQNHPQFTATNRDQVELAFVIVHYAGPVRYQTQGFCDKNKDKPHQEIFDLLTSSENPFVVRMCRPVDVLTEAENDALPTRHRKSSLLSLGLGSQFRRQLHQLLEMIGHTQPHYIRCLKPNDANTKQQFHRQRMADQLRYGGVLEAVRIARLGYPVHMKHDAFVSRYAVLVKRTNTLSRPKSVVQALTNQASHEWPLRNMENAAAVKSKSAWYRFGIEIGKTVVFLRQATYDFLEKQRQQHLHRSAVKIQAFACMAMCMSRYQSTYDAILCMQRWIRGFLGRCEGRRRRNHLYVALRLQSWFRGWQRRRWFHAWKEQRACLRIQRQWHRWRVQRQYIQVLQSILAIQCMWRCKQARQALKARKVEALSLQHTILERNQLRQELVRTQSEAQIARERAAQAEKELQQMRILLHAMQADPIRERSFVGTTASRGAEPSDVPPAVCVKSVRENTDNAMQVTDTDGFTSMDKLASAQRQDSTSESKTIAAAISHYEHAPPSSEKVLPLINHHALSPPSISASDLEAKSLPDSCNEKHNNSALHVCPTNVSHLSSFHDQDSSIAIPYLSSSIEVEGMTTPRMVETQTRTLFSTENVASHDNPTFSVSEPIDDGAVSLMPVCRSCMIK